MCPMSDEFYDMQFFFTSSTLNTVVRSWVGELSKTDKLWSSGFLYANLDIDFFELLASFANEKKSKRLKLRVQSSQL